MRAHYLSRFVFETTSNVRTFRHQPSIHHPHVECASCHSPVEANEPYSHHWLSCEDAQHTKLDLEKKLLLRQIEKERIETFMICDETQQYGGRFYFERYSFSIKHFLDIEATVDMVIGRLAQKICSYMYMAEGVTLDSCAIRRIKLTVKRLNNGPEVLPLQYRIKNSGGFKAKDNNKKPVNLSLLNESYLNYHGKRFGKFHDSLQVNLYCFHVCPETKELIAVLYLIRSEDVKNTPTFVIQTDVTGEFRGMYEIHNIRRFLRTEPNDRFVECSVCMGAFTSRMHFVLHKQMDCGNEVEVLQMDGESFETYENCITLPKEFFKLDFIGIRPNY
ncbi:hypothetical protein KR215_011904 [Drosophila sulfurigaster]|nr:hypothetical protein KR215_011904 [Drosophila sulfurigaster]